MHTTLNWILLNSKKPDVSTMPTAVLFNLLMPSAAADIDWMFVAILLVLAESAPTWRLKLKSCVTSAVFLVMKLPIHVSACVLSFVTAVVACESENNPPLYSPFSSKYLLSATPDTSLPSAS